MSEWVTPKTDWDTDPEAPTGASMNRIEGNTEYLKESLPYKLFQLTGNDTGGTGTVLSQGFFVKIPDEHKLVLKTVNFALFGTNTNIQLGKNGGSATEYFDGNTHGSNADLFLNQDMETNTSGSDVGVVIEVRTINTNQAGWTFKLALEKL